jgi:hypothetical protein
VAGKTSKLTLNIPTSVLRRLEAAAKRKGTTVEAVASQLLNKVPNKVGSPGKPFFQKRRDEALDALLLLYAMRPGRRLSRKKDLADLGRKAFKDQGDLLSRYNRIAREFRKSGAATAEEFVTTML